jgi:hypothetical protein
LRLRDARRRFAHDLTPWRSGSTTAAEPGAIQISDPASAADPGSLVPELLIDRLLVSEWGGGRVRLADRWNEVFHHRADTAKSAQKNDPSNGRRRLQRN